MSKKKGKFTLSEESKETIKIVLIAYLLYCMEKKKATHEFVEMIMKLIVSL